MTKKKTEYELTLISFYGGPHDGGHLSLQFPLGWAKDGDTFMARGKTQVHLYTMRRTGYCSKRQSFLLAATFVESKVL